MDVSVEDQEDGYYLVKLQADALELNVRASRDDLRQLRAIGEANWETRSSIAAGRCAGAPVFWCSNNGTATLLVGLDDETWDVAVTVPLEVVATIVSEMEALQPT